MKVSRVGLVVLALLPSACGLWTTAKGIAPLRGRADVSIAIGPPGGGDSGALWLSADNAVPCLGSDTVATLNGKPLRALEGVPDPNAPTSGIPVVDSSTRDSCGDATWTSDDDSDFQQPTLDVVISDHTGAIEATFVNVIAPRTFQIVSPADGTAHVGDAVTLALEPPTDVFTIDAFGVIASFDRIGPTALAYSSISDSDHSGECTSTTRCAVVSVSGATGTLVVPPGAAGDVSVWLWESGQVGWSRCDVGTCQLNAIHETNEVALRVSP